MRRWLITVATTARAHSALACLTPGEVRTALERSRCGVALLTERELVGLPEELDQRMGQVRSSMTITSSAILDWMLYQPSRAFQGSP